jgi:sugar/nucleoside kinase (ribokinase family)
MTNVVTVGVHIVDVLARSVDQVPTESGGQLVEEIRMTVAGTAAGTAIDLAKLGAMTTSTGAVGSDEFGDFVVGVMSGYGINVSHLVRKKDVQTSATVLLVRPDGERIAFHVPGANREFSLEDINWNVIDSADYLHLGGTYALRKLDGQPAAELLRHAHQRGVVTTMDVLGTRSKNPAAILEPCLPYVDYFMPNLAEARQISGLRDPQEVGRFFVDRGAGAAIITMAAAGSLMVTPDGAAHIPALDVAVVDATGCGDAYCAGFIMGLSTGWPAEKACRLGAAAAGLVIGGVGSDAGMVDLPTTVAFMEEGRPKVVQPDP